MQRFIITHYVTVQVPKVNTNPYLDSQYELDEDGKVVYQGISVPRGFYIGPGVKSYKPSHPTKKVEYYKRRNVPKELRKVA